MDKRTQYNARWIKRSAYILTTPGCKWVRPLLAVGSVRIPTAATLAVVTRQGLHVARTPAKKQNYWNPMKICRGILLLTFVHSKWVCLAQKWLLHTGTPSGSPADSDLTTLRVWPPILPPSRCRFCSKSGVLPKIKTKLTFSILRINCLTYLFRIHSFLNCKQWCKTLQNWFHLKLNPWILQSWKIRGIPSRHTI